MARTIFIIIMALLPKCLMADNDTITSAKQPFRQTRKNVYKTVKEINNIDTTYIEPEHYNFTAMLQNTNTYEVYHLRSNSGQTITFAPKPTVKIGPYFGWRWIFAGYTFDISHLAGKTRQEYDLSIYSSKIGIDIFYRKSGDDYRIKNINLNNDIDTDNIKNTPFKGLHVGITGASIYYIFNHRKFSYPAAFSQSTRQKISCGTPLIGIGYTRHSLDFDYQQFINTINQKTPHYQQQADTALMFRKLKYTDISVSGGYAYNLCLTRNLLLAASLSIALGYKHTSGKADKEKFNLRNFATNNLVIDGAARLGIVWNNDKHFAGASLILHSYNSHKPQLTTNNIFGNLNIYTGIKFGKRKSKNKH